ncbi:hypothetical protein HOM13_03885 [Candidatus Woesearchaeota archaeon]|nr:hypothetical protein [Candidatus Woesearchaeota archaeon]MBT5215850.1 hypothetical protein [Candidatus Woesearchaeota archaeon]MBT6402378.1 hypothetical protein [Candidatus Woesearchaeota archaeon]
MEFLEVSTVWLILYAYLGLVLGYLLKKITKEEMIPGESYFRNSELVLMLLVGLFSLSIFIFNLSYSLVGLFVLGLIIGTILRSPYFVFALGLSFAIGRFSLVLASLVFIFGLLESSLKWGRSLLIENFMYFLLPALVMVYYNLNFVNEFLVMAFVSGFSFSYAYRIISKN